MILNLGVIDQIYGQAKSQGYPINITTGGVAQLLEDEYGVMDGFVFLHQPEIAEDLAESVASALENMMAGAPPGLDPMGDAMGDIEKRFRQYLDNEEIVYTGATGVPTKAALSGKSKRFKRSRGPRRPSFIDTGLYEASFKAWIDY